MFKPPSNQSSKFILLVALFLVSITSLYAYTPPPKYQKHHFYGVTDIVEHNGHIYKCKDSGFCENPEYEPRLYPKYKQAWEDINANTPAPTKQPWKAYLNYKAGDKIIYDNKIYKCKLAPYTPWCSQREPGTNGWEQAWELTKELTDESILEAINKLRDNELIPKLDKTSSMSGIDANNNGIRDDIDRFINLLPITDLQKDAARYFARFMQKSILIDLNNKVDLGIVDGSLNRSVHCLQIRLNGNLNIRHIIMKTIESGTANTYKRSLQYIKFNSAENGTGAVYPKSDTCAEGDLNKTKDVNQ